MNKSMIFIVLFLLNPLVTNAESGWTGYAQVAELTATNQFRYLIMLPTHENPSGCKEKQIYYLDYNAPGATEMFHILLEAVSRGSKVRLYVSGNCELNGYSQITAVTIAR